MDPSDRIRSKILSRADLLARREEARRQGKTVVQCHGCFDIVHPGHVRHLQHAAREGDFLLVTITADAVMNKGLGRPLFPQELRAENLAALDCVDWVYINPDPTAEKLLDEVRPDIYLKGREYESNDDPRFAAERRAVERHGGRVVFSSGDVVFSSTALVSALEHRADPFHSRLKQLIHAHDLTPARLDTLIDSFRGRRVCVLGEVITDTYVMCDRPEVAGESPVMALRPVEQVSFDGGAAILARHMAAMGARPLLLTVLPRSTQAEALRQRLRREGVEVRWLDTEPGGGGGGGAMLEKQRFLVGEQKVMKLDLVRPIALDAGRQAELLDMAVDAAGQCEAFILEDFGCGLFTQKLVREMCGAVRKRVGFLAGDVSGRRSSLLHMRGLDLICPTESEMRDALRDFDSSLNAVVWKLLEATRSKQAIVTLGPDGLIAFDRLREAPTGGEGAASAASAATTGWTSKVRGEHIPALVPHAVDPLGCGDALLSAAVLTMLAGGSLADAAFLGAVSAASEASRLGNEVISARDLRAGVESVAGGKLGVATARLGARAVV